MDKNLINKIKNEKINYIVEWWEEDSLDIDMLNKILKFIGIRCLQKRKSL